MGGSSPSTLRPPRPTRGLVDCPICTSTLVDPKILPCGHSFCGPNSEQKCLIKLEKNQTRRGEIRCPMCQRVHQVQAENVPSPFGFEEMLESMAKMRVCEKHNSEIRYYCVDHEEELCDRCWSETHLNHKIELIEIAQWRRLLPPWERRMLPELRAFCLETVESLSQGIDYLLDRKDRYIKIADLCLSLHQKQHNIDQQFKKKQFDHSDKNIAEFDLYLKHIKEESEKLKQDMAKLDEMTTELNRLTRETASELEKRLGEAVASRETVPTDTIIAFGDDGKNEIWRSGTNDWKTWGKGRDYGNRYACVKAHSNIYIIGGQRGEHESPETDIYDISREEWSKGPQLNVARRGASACFDATRNHIFVVGGYNNGPLKSVDRLKVDKLGRPTGVWEKLTDMTPRRDRCFAVVLDEKLFVSGGYTGSGKNTATASVEVLDLRSTRAEWKECAPIPDERGGHAMIAFNNQLFVFGGWNGTKKLASCEKYSPLNNTWQKISNMRVPREACGVCLMGDKIYVVGGDCHKGEDDKTVEVYNPDRDEWTEGPSMTRAIDITKCVSW